MGYRDASCSCTGKNKIINFGVASPPAKADESADAKLPEGLVGLSIEVEAQTSDRHMVCLETFKCT